MHQHTKVCLFLWIHRHNILRHRCRKSVTPAFSLYRLSRLLLRCYPIFNIHTCIRLNAHHYSGQYPLPIVSALYHSVTIRPRPTAQYLSTLGISKWLRRSRHIRLSPPFSWPTYIVRPVYPVLKMLYRIWTALDGCRQTSSHLALLSTTILPSLSCR